MRFYAVNCHLLHLLQGFYYVLIIHCRVYNISHVYVSCKHTPRVVSVDELRWFWISWQDDVFHFGSGYRPRLNIIHSLRYYENRVPPINIMAIASHYNNTQSFWSIPEVYYIPGKCIIHRARSWPGGPWVRILPPSGPEATREICANPATNALKGVT